MAIRMTWCEPSPINICRLWRSLLMVCVKAGKDEEATKFHQFIAQSYQESVNGAALCMPRFVCVARKPGG